MSELAATRAQPTPAVTQTRAGELLQRKCACGSHTIAGGECDACGEKKNGVLRRSASGAGHVGGGVPSVVGEVLGGSGRPLDAGTRSFMETRFGHDFSRVRVHSDSKADESARAVGARAYTVGHSMVFGAGEYAPESNAGRLLLAHELTHVVQQQSAGSAVQTQLEIGSTQDPAEAEADRVARQVLSVGPNVATPGAGGFSSPKIMRTPAVLRRQPADTNGAADNTTPQKIGETRLVRIPERQVGEEKIVSYVMRKLVACPCRRVPEMRQGLYWNPNPGNMAVAFRYCSGSKNVDVYAQLKSNLPTVVSSGADPQGTATAGVDVQIGGARVRLEGVGTNEGSGPGVGGRTGATVNIGGVPVFIDFEYIRRLDPGQGVNPNDITGGGGVRIKGVEIGLKCSEIGGVQQCLVTVGNNRDPKHDTKEECWTCYCPPAMPKYQCIDLEQDREVPKEIETRPLGEFRYYFKLDSIEPNKSVKTESDRQMGEVASELSKGGTIESIIGYASPEAIERTHNQKLSEERGRETTKKVREKVGSGTQVPEGTGGGELYGRRFADPTPVAQQAITGSQFRSSEELSHFLIGSDEIPNKELSDRFVHIFTVLPDPADRLSLFGMTPSDPLASDTLAAINEFMKNPRRGKRPWDKVFQYLRVGVVRVRRKVMKTIFETKRGDTKVLSDDECAANARIAETMQPGFGPIDEAAKRPHSSTADAKLECQSEPSSADTELGCKYPPLVNAGRPKTAPDMAPRPFGK
ncbi:MAG TPA: DUF4157 domain-containing protein [Pyrinomonadaceae bacterium]|nr:DUF4157 domain-containing protein [Pyrinomonadaceae bacterium]